MANKNMTFSASLRLNTKEFRKGITDVQKSLKSLQNSFLGVAGALGIGLSINRLGSSFMDTATKLSVAKNTLQNVSKEIGEYGENLEWLRKISNKYGQDMITLTNSFAQFRAAASSSKLSLDEMREVYEALTRAAGAYHMSADRTNDMMNAVTQMLSKGKVAAEELRRQLGNSLPGAFNLMAQAAYNAGVITENSTAALEDAMKKGKVMAEDVLPSFAKILNDVTANADFNSLQTSINRMKNSFTELVENANFEGLYKGMVDAATKTLNWLKADFWPTVIAGFAGIFGGPALLKGMRNMSTQLKSEAGVMVKELEAVKRANTDLGKDILTNYNTLKRMGANTGNARTRGFFGLEDYSKRSAYDVVGTSSKGGDLLRLNKDYLKAAAAAREYNQQLLDINKLSKQLYGRGIISPEGAKEITETNKKLDGLLNSFRKNTKEINSFAGVTKLLTNVWKSFIGVLKTAFASFAIGAVISGITYLVSKLIEARKEAKRIAGISEEMKAAVDGVSGAEDETVIKLTQIDIALSKINKDTPAALKQELYDNVNKALGRTKDNFFKIEDSIDNVREALGKYIGKIQETARQQAILAQISSATSRVIQLGVENEMAQQDDNYLKQERKFRPGIGMSAGSYEKEFTKEAKKLNDKINKNNKEIAELNKGIDILKGMASEDTLKALRGGETSGSTPPPPPPPGGKSKGTPQAVIADYKQDLMALENQFKAGAIMAAEYEDKLKKLNSKAFEDLAAFGWEKVQKELKNDGALLDSIKSAAQKAILEGLDNPEAIDEFDKEMAESADKALNEFREAWDRYLNYVKQKPTASVIEAEDAYMKSNRRGKGETYSERDTYLNSKVLDATKSDISGLEAYKKQLEDALKVETDTTNIERLNKLLGDTIDRIEVLKASATDLRAKVDIASLEKEIVDLKKEGLDSVFSSITTLSNGMDNLYRAFQSIQQINDSTWNNEELENFLTTMNALIQVFEVMKGLYTALNAVIKVHDKIKEKSAMKAVALNHMEAASEVEKGAASAGAAAAGGASSVASIPIVGPALAVAAVASIVAAIMAGMSKFATGGIVGGNSYSGDKQVARVNSGEMILNKGQQATLFNAIKSGNLGGGGNVQFKIRGCDLVSVLENEARRVKG